MSERREHFRIPIDQMVEVRFGKEKMIQATGTDLSVKGILCVARSGVDPQSRVFLMFRLPILHEEFEVECEGIVVRSAEADGHFEVAVQITGLGTVEHTAIEAFTKHTVTENEKREAEEKGE
jgi:hypothetical protein